MAMLRTALFTLFFYGGSVLFVPLVALVSLLSKRALRRGCNLWARWHRVCARVFLGISVRVEGKIPPGGHFFVLKHESMFEAVDTLALFHQPMVVQKKELLDIPVWGWVARRHGVIAIDRSAGGTALRQMVKGAKDAVAADRPIILFPEGTRTPHGEKPPLKVGMSALYRMLDMPVIPVAVNAGRLIKSGRFAKQAGEIVYKVGEPIPAGLSKDEIEVRVHDAINALNA